MRTVWPSGCYQLNFYGIFDDMVRVAVKTPKPDLVQIEKFLDEAKNIYKFKHKHIVQLLGVSTLKEPICSCIM